MSEEGNIWFERTEHVWDQGKCTLCSASKAEYDRGPISETHAYKFIHETNISETIGKIFGGKMHFDVIIGNPPYQLNDGGGASGMGASPIYQHFIDQAKLLDPRFLIFVIPARWYAGGRGLDDFRDEMLSDTRIRMIEDYPDSSSVFPGTHVKSGVCFFLWDRDNPGDARITTHRSETSKSVATRPLREPGADVFLRYNESISIIKKVMAFENETTFAKVSLQLPEAKRFSNLVSARKPFGIPSNYRGKEARQKKTDLVIYQNYGHGYVPVSEIRMGKELIDSWKVFLGKAYGGDEKYPHAILSQPFIGEPQSVCTETYLVVGPFSSKRKCEVVVDYISTRLFRFLVLLRKPTQNSSRSTYSYVPILDFSRFWSDDDLASRYSLTRTEQEFIESMVRPMGADDE